MNNNRNNRRRGRGNNRSQGGGQVNRIDSRARGNAPQLLEKYRKMAQDASLNGDRVQAEYYLQFADHYFRVLADSRPQRDDTRPRRDDQRDMDQDSNYLDGDEDDGEQPYRRPEPRRDEAREEPESEPYGSAQADDDNADGESSNPFEPPENPFTRGNRQRERTGDRDRGEKRAPRRPRSPVAEEARGEEIEPKGIDAAVLPPAIGAAPVVAADEAEEKPAPRRRGRKPRSEAGDETLEKVG